MTRIRVLGVVAVAALALVAAPTGVPAQAVADHPGDRAGDRAADHLVLREGSAVPRVAPRARLGTYRCGGWRKHAVVYNWYFRECARLSRLEGTFDRDHRTEVWNGFRRQRVPFHCEHEKKTTWRFHASVTGSAKAGVIFAKVETSVTAGVERSVESVDRMKAPFWVAPRSWGYCERGTQVYRFAGNTRAQFKEGRRGTPRWWRGTVERFRGTAPSRFVFKVGPGRLIG